MKRNIIKTTFGVLITAVAIYALGWAGQSDYEDAVITEMKNNGTYYELSRQRPDMSEHDMVVYNDSIRFNR